MQSMLQFVIGGLILATTLAGYLVFASLHNVAPQPETTTEQPTHPNVSFEGPTVDERLAAAAEPLDKPEHYTLDRATLRRLVSTHISSRANSLVGVQQGGLLSSFALWHLREHSAPESLSSLALLSGNSDVVPEQEPVGIGSVAMNTTGLSLHAE